MAYFDARLTDAELIRAAEGIVAGGPEIANAATADELKAVLADSVAAPPPVLAADGTFSVPGSRRLGNGCR